MNPTDTGIRKKTHLKISKAVNECPKILIFLF